ncbi:unnamed protein product [Darwinula stevensoni]|uniref:NF-kappa-B-repressing factor n=1 Tax=Darwinula stevensoni TaxID=69355 RepID=A0A7R8X0K6_9CRUS|nr:unnamed protein product [Darwinula stevensoni]CAG0881327.1 unnamed protein product [Darwinula stevensoni]
MQRYAVYEKFTLQCRNYDGRMTTEPMKNLRLKNDENPEFDQGWDIEKYKSVYEPDDHWELRKAFMEMHKDKFPEDRLVCLANCFVNMEILGCSYPEETMALVGELSRGLIEDFREKKRNKLQRTFVEASAAASSKAKGQRKPPMHGAPPVKSSRSDSSLDIRNVKSADVAPAYSTDKYLSSTSNRTALEGSIHRDHSAHDVKTRNLKLRVPDDYWKSSDPLVDFILMDHQYCEQNAISMLTSSAAFSKADLCFLFNREDEKMTRCDIRLNDVQVASGWGPSEAAAKTEACKTAICSLQAKCFTVRVKSFNTSDKEVSKGQVEFETDVQEQTIGEDNIGNRLLKMMGWQGGGLGKEGSGITEPLQMARVCDRQGLGSAQSTGVSKEFCKTIEEIIKEYATSSTLNDLAFTPEFTRDERKEIHTISHKFNLKSHSHGKDDSRYLVLSKKLTSRAIIRHLIEDAGTNDKYELIPPTQGFLSDSR